MIHDEVSRFTHAHRKDSIIEASANRMGIDMSKVIVNIDPYANTTAGTIPICLYEALVENKRLKKGDYAVMAAFGAGFSWGSVLMRWWE